MPIFQLGDRPIFPDPRLADQEGLLAVDGALGPEWLLAAYRKGIFPWFNEGERILWWSPDPRLVLFPRQLKVSHSMKQVLNRMQFRVSFDEQFAAVIHACASVDRGDQWGTWISPEVERAYVRMHELGIAHSVEVWEGKELVGGLYGLALGQCFFGESMFSLRSNASKAGFITLVRWLQHHHFQMIDCQVRTEHLVSLGAVEISRAVFMERLQDCLQTEAPPGPWQAESD